MHRFSLDLTPRPGAGGFPTFPPPGILLHPPKRFFSCIAFVGTSSAYAFFLQSPSCLCPTSSQVKMNHLMSRPAIAATNSPLSCLFPLVRAVRIKNAPLLLIVDSASRSARELHHFVPRLPSCPFPRGKMALDSPRARGDIHSPAAAPPPRAPTPVTYWNLSPAGIFLFLFSRKRLLARHPQAAPVVGPSVCHIYLLARNRHSTRSPLFFFPGLGALLSIGHGPRLNGH